MNNKEIAESLAGLHVHGVGNQCDADCWWQRHATTIEAALDEKDRERDAAYDWSAKDEALAKALEASEAEVEFLKAWVSDLQAGTWVNCVYCGHRYGPGETTPVSMADALKEHIRKCSKHPLSAAEAREKRLREALAALAKGSWNVGRAKPCDFREFAREALAKEEGR